MKILQLLIILLGFWGLNSCSYLSEENNLIAGVELSETANYISLRPQSTSVKSTGLMFYPGGLVDPHAYMSMLQGMVLEGYQVVIFKVAANLAILDGNTSQSYLKSFEGVDQWVLAGHSLGGVVGAMDIHGKPDNYVGLVLMASFPSSSNDLSTWGGAVLSLSASLDSLATPQDIEDNKQLLPTGNQIDQLVDMPITSTKGQCIYHEIQGGNHAQFGSYGAQKDDGVATISKAAQHQEITAYIRSFFNANQW